MWIDNYEFNVGAIGYLVETVNTSNGGTSFALHERPLRTNQSHQPRLTGWCGEDNNRSKTAKGAWKVAQRNAAGDRARIVQLKGADLCAFLSADGHPDLIPESLKSAWDKGEADGAEEVETVLAEQGRDIVLATLAPGHLGWDEGALNAGAHKIDGVPNAQKDIYYRAYAIAARARAEEIRDEKAA